MNTVYSTPAKFVPIMNEIKSMSEKDRKELITLIEMSLDKDETHYASDKTRKCIEQCAGTWVGEETAEEIIANIYNSRKSSSEPVTF